KASRVRRPNPDTTHTKSISAREYAYEKPPGARMRAQFQRLENVHAVVASAAAMTLLVAGALSWLGWRLLSQEQALDQQRRRDRLEQVADGLLAGLLRALTEAEAALAQVG